MAHGSQASRDAYNSELAAWIARGRPATPPPVAPQELTINELVVAYWAFAQTYYVRTDGRPSGSLESIKVALRYLCEGHGRLPAGEFGPRALDGIRSRMIDANLSRRYINDQVDRIRRVFKWGVAQELVPVETHQALQTLSGLRRGRSRARETPPVRPVDDHVVAATLPFLGPVVADMVRIQRLTGCRPAEVCSLRPIDIDQRDDVWAFRPATHKTDHLDKQRVIFLGPRSQQILRPYLARPPEAYCFSPQESEADRQVGRRRRRQSPLTPSQRARQAARNRRRAPRPHYDTHSYRRAIHRACDEADRAARKAAGEEAGNRMVPRWSPNQLRHTAATEIRQHFGLEAAQVTLGHASADVTQIYAERDQARAREVMRAIG